MSNRNYLINRRGYRKSNMQNVFFSPYFCPLCGDDAIEYSPECFVEVCIPCKRNIRKKYLEFSETMQKKKLVLEYFKNEVENELLKIALAPDRFHFFLEYNSLWIK